MKQYCIFIIAIMFMPAILLAQVKIEERVEIEPVEQKQNKKNDVFTITNATSIARCEIEWDLHERETLITAWGMNEDAILGERYWKSGGSHSLEITNLKTTNFFFQVRANLYSGEKLNGHYRIYFDNHLLYEGGLALTGSKYSIAYGNIEIGPLISNMSLTLEKGIFCPNTSLDFYLGSFSYTPFPLNAFRPNRDKVKFSIILGEEHVKFYNGGTKELLNDFEVGFSGIRRCNLFQIDEVEIIDSALVVIEARANNVVAYDSVWIFPPRVDYFVDGAFWHTNLIHNQMSLISCYVNPDGHCWTYEDLPEDGPVTYTAEIISGGEYGELKNPDNGQSGKKVSITVDTRYYWPTLQYIANGVEPLDEDTIKVRLSSSMNENDYKDISTIIKRANLLVEAVPNQLSVSDMADFIIQFRDESGNVIDFPANQLFYVAINEGSDYGTLLSADGVTNGLSLSDEVAGFKFIANDSIDVDTATIIIYIDTFIEEDVPASVASNHEQIISLRKNLKRKTVKGEELIAKQDLELSSGQYLYGYATLEIKKGSSCEDFACGDNFIYEAPTIELQRIYSSTYKGIDYCNKGIRPVGQFIPLFDANDDIYTDDALKDELIVPFDVEACYNSSANDGKGGWQFSINSESENNFKLRSLIFTCENNIESGDADNIISSFADLNAIPDTMLCQALKDLDNMRPYPFSWEDRTPEEYYLLPSAVEHEETHSRRFEVNIIEIALGQKTDLLGEKLSFKEHLNFQPYCTNLFDSREEAARRTKELYEGLLTKFSKIADELYQIQAGDSQGNIKEKQAHIDNENYTQWNKKVQDIITDYIVALENICLQRGVEICKYTEDGKWKEFEKYRNDI